MSRIPQADLIVLQSASAVKTVASTAVAEAEEMSVAHRINEAANCGECKVTYNFPISNALKTKLEGLGYVLTSPQPIAKTGEVTIISWEDAE